MAQQSYSGNIITNVDSYKNAHFWMYPEGTEYVSSYIESRGGIYPSVLFAGLQPFLREYLMHPFTIDDIHEAHDVHTSMGIPFERQNWIDLLNDHGGYLPLEIEAVPEGTVVPTRNVLVQVVNTDPKYHWVTGFIETALLRAVWYPSSVATTSWIAKQRIRGFLERTSDHPEMIRIYLHDYGARGVSSFESAALGGVGHLINFDQTDNVPGYIGSRRWYNGPPPSGAAVFLEHAAIGAAGRDQEAATFRRLLQFSAPAIGLLCDTYDHDNAVQNIIGRELKTEVRDYGGLVIARCDSGDPIMVPADTVESLMESFGSETNGKGYRVLPPFMRVVQGDGLTLDTYVSLYAELERRGLAADNVLCGMGGGLLQKVDRDSMNFGMKASAVCVNGEWRDVFKAPKGSQMKRSKAGRLALCKVDGEYRTVRRDEVSAEENLLTPVFRNGKLLREWSMSDLIQQSELPTPPSYYADTAETSTQPRPAALAG
ncbi:nicotinate phosphoribosyltransferase [Mycobacterium saskatchewanense]|uniref:Nicotinamide phosphoribosyltransferase n=1 Tax=Mycobacterium saskatchewanense TaxID=220927 RepID=A0AAJ3NKE4_9MYCO|nr:nicotinate phosphoribosyltransferase [Mycobacterium saskatchewanense]ORW64093.1 nicotinate phosphoribosyltransferase [Mycobacterium saskatchewanense]BBX62225.1 nicotinate phosphoribosyltransferase [Mycobacterium saskatchewanense]